MLPQELGCDSGMTCWRHLRDWQATGVWEWLHRMLLVELGHGDAIGWKHACIDNVRIPAEKGASHRAGSNEPWKAGHEARSCYGPRRHATRLVHHRRESQRYNAF